MDTELLIGRLRDVGLDATVLASPSLTVAQRARDRETDELTTLPRLSVDLGAGSREAGSPSRW